uniref:Isopenicillin N synthase-like Fe(2+) 2OG dioxygenase domain-containing protein n=1 Tax=Quercus lobata TaxID=97700 RepID=A0A7N2KVV2_QUELO
MFEQPLREKMKHLRNKFLTSFWTLKTNLKNYCLDGGRQWRSFIERLCRIVIGSFLRSLFMVNYQLSIPFCAVARAVARIIALALDLKVDFFDQPEMLGEPIAILHLLHYEGGISDPLKGIFGAGAHSDYGLITLLATNGVSSLQICKDRDAKRASKCNIYGNRLRHLV